MTGRVLPPGTYGGHDLEQGAIIDAGSEIVTAEMIDRFADLTGDRFEIHMTDAAAKRHGFDARVAHGLLILSLVDGLKNRAAAQLKARASLGWDWRFRAPVLAGDRIHVRLTIAALRATRHPDQCIATLDFDVTNADGTAVQDGTNQLLIYR